MKSTKNKMLKDFASPLRIWLRYIDDTFVVLKKTEVVSFHKFINNIEDSIKFTVEQEVGNAIPFLDVLTFSRRESTNIVLRVGGG